MKLNRFFYFLAFALSSISVYVFGGRIAYVFFYVVLFLPLISFVHVLTLRIVFRYSIGIDRKFIMKGDSINLIVTVRNKSPLFYPLVTMVVRDMGPAFSIQPQTKSFSLLPFSGNELYFEAECRYRGRHSIGINSAAFVDFLGIIKLTKKKNMRMPLTVYPKVVFLDYASNMNVISPQALLSSNQYDTDMLMVSDMRKYVFGDSLKKIHWKLTAKSSELIIKNFEKTMDTETVIVLDLKHYGPQPGSNVQIEDKVIEAAAAVAHLSLSNRIPVHLTYCTNEIKTVEVRDPAGFERIHAILAEVQFNEESDVGFILEEYIKNRKQHRNVILVTYNINEALYQKLYELKSSGFNLSVVFVSRTASADTEGKNEALRQKDIKIYTVNAGEELKDAFERQAV